MHRYDLLIFDFDGTLVPTEDLATRIMTELSAEHLGMNLTPQEFAERYMGWDLASQFADMELLYGAPLPQAFFDALDVAWTTAVETELEPSVGATAALKELASIPRCIASNGTGEHIELALRSTGLDAYFDRYFCADDVEHPKPAPDIYLLAASTMGVEPDRCLVVEDTRLGVQAARTAGMDVVGYTGNGSHDAQALQGEGAIVINHFSELAEVVRSRHDQ